MQSEDHETSNRKEDNHKEDWQADRKLNSKRRCQFKNPSPQSPQVLKVRCCSLSLRITHASQYRCETAFGNLGGQISWLQNTRLFNTRLATSCNTVIRWTKLGIKSCSIPVMAILSIAVINSSNVMLCGFSGTQQSFARLLELSESSCQELTSPCLNAHKFALGSPMWCLHF